MLARRADTYEPEDLQVLGSIFDETWGAIASAFDHADEVTRASVRTRLAALLLQLAGDEAGHESLRQTVLHIFLQAPDPSIVSNAPSSR
jgi:hypothetical protein